MFGIENNGKRGRRARRQRPVAWLLVLGLVVGLTGCEGLLDVENPNNVLQDDLQKPRSAAAIVNGALSATARSYSNVTLAHVTLTDEFDWVGSWNAAGELEQGELGNSSNNYTNSGFNNLAVSRWTSDEAIRLLEGFAEQDLLDDMRLLARAYLYSGLNHALYADSYEDVAFSDRQETGAPVGAENMIQVYDMAIEQYNRAIDLANQTGADAVALAGTALRARAHWGKALWPKFNPPGSTPSDPLVNSADANADAGAILQAVGGTDWTYRFGYSSSTIDNDAAGWINSRLELVVGDEYAKADSTGKQICMPTNSACPEEGIVLMDPIDGVPAPALRDIVYEFVEGFTYPPMTVVSEREMHLIVAEAALAGGSVPGGTGVPAAVLHINHVREMDGLTLYDPAVHTDISPMELLQHTRRVNMFLQAGRRLPDLYRFGETVKEWAPASEAVTQPGTFFPIGEEERLSNCFILGTC